MSKFIKYDTTLTDVTSFSDNYDNRSLSARPQFTGNQYNVTLYDGFSATHILEGYSFESVTDVMLSCTDNNPLFTDASGLTSVSRLILILYQDCLLHIQRLVVMLFQHLY